MASEGDVEKGKQNNADENVSSIVIRLFLVVILRNNAETIICQRAFPCETKIPVPFASCSVRDEREPVTFSLSPTRKSLGICLAGKMRLSVDLQIKPGKLVFKGRL